MYVYISNKISKLITWQLKCSFSHSKVMSKSVEILIKSSLTGLDISQEMAFTFIDAINTFYRISMKY